MGTLFGTDGIRAVAGDYPLDPSTIFKLGLALVRLGDKRILIGRDTRASGVWIQRVLEMAIRAEGGEPDLVGVMTTPAISFLSRTQPFDAGIVISASHNPYQDNGIKIFSHEGLKLSDQDENRLEDMLAANKEEYRMPAGIFDRWQDELRIFEGPQIAKYIDFVRGVAGGPLTGFQIVMDCANGAAFHIGPRVFQELGADVRCIGIDPDGHNINEGCGALHPQPMMSLTAERGATFGVAFDGDSDRAILSDEQGNLVDGDHVLFILGSYLKEHSSLATNCVVTTVMANLGLELALREQGLSMIRTKVGDRYVLEEMLKGGHSLGGEQSGHIIIREHAVTGDGVLTAVKIAQLIRDTGKPLSELRKGIQKFPQILVNLRVREKKAYSEIPSIVGEIRAVEERMQDRGRVVVRYSGTEPLVRIMLEGEKQDEIARYAEAIAARFREALGEN